MAASTILYAPVVPAIQPAFIYYSSNPNQEVGVVKIYYSLSAYNSGNFGDIKKIKVSIVDPNKASAWGSNGMLADGSATFEVDPVDKCIEINLLGNIKKINDEDIEEEVGFKTFALNQYYQVQLSLIYDEENESPPSQITLIRPIAAMVGFIESNHRIIPIDTTEIKGGISYEDGSVIEQIKEAYFTVRDYVSPVERNFLGTSFKIPVRISLDEYKGNEIKVTYTTVNGYVGVINSGIKIEVPNPEKFAGSYAAVQNESYNGTNELFTFDLAGPYVFIERADEDYDYQNWTRQAVFSSFDSGLSGVKWGDFTANGKKKYQYRFGQDGVSLGVYENRFNLTTDFEDIYLSNKDYLLAIKYNPDISNLKWVTQESITNTLGGQFPIVRINGDTFYRQFSLNGSLSFDVDAKKIEESRDSSGVLMSGFMPDSDCSLFIGKENKSIALSKLERVRGNQLRDIALSFLTDRRPKFFRSPTEGNMVVYLSGVSFKPNKQLGREVYDFSATATEVCNVTPEAMKKYNLNPVNEFKDNAAMAYIPVRDLIKGE